MTTPRRSTPPLGSVDWTGTTIPDDLQSDWLYGTPAVHPPMRMRAFTLSSSASVSASSITTRNRCRPPAVVAARTETAAKPARMAIAVVVGNGPGAPRAAQWPPAWPPPTGWPTVAHRDARRGRGCRWLGRCRCRGCRWPGGRPARAGRGSRSPSRPVAVAGSGRRSGTARPARRTPCRARTTRWWSSATGRRPRRRDGDDVGSPADEPAGEERQRHARGQRCPRPPTASFADPSPDHGLVPPLGLPVPLSVVGVVGPAHRQLPGQDSQETARSPIGPRPRASARAVTAAVTTTVALRVATHDQPAHRR